MFAICVLMWGLCACGGHIDDDASAKSVSIVPVQAARLLASFADCFSYVPGTRFDMSDGTKWLIIEEAFQGQAAFGAAQLRDDGTRFGTQYYAIESGQIRLLGDNTTDVAGATSSTSVYFSDYRIPLTLSAGEFVHFSGLSTMTSTPEAVDTAVDIQTTQQLSTITYLGHETLRLDDHTFTNACKVQSVGSSFDVHDADNVLSWARVLWFAQGYGVIQSEDYDAQGRAVPGSRHQLVKIIAVR